MNENSSFSHGARPYPRKTEGPLVSWIVWKRDTNCWRYLDDESAIRQPQFGKDASNVVAWIPFELLERAPLEEASISCRVLATPFWRSDDSCERWQPKFSRVRCKVGRSIDYLVRSDRCTPSVCCLRSCHSRHAQQSKNCLLCWHSMNTTIYAFSKLVLVLGLCLYQNISWHTNLIHFGSDSQWHHISA